MKIGINLLLWTGNPTAEHVALIEQAAQWGFDGVEIPIHHYNEDIYKGYKAKLDELGLGCTSTTVMPPDQNPISPDPAVRAKGIEHLKRALDMCGILGCDVMAGPVYSPVGAITGSPRTDDEWNWAVEALTAAADHAETVGVDIGIEALNRFETYFINTIEDACALAKAVGKPRAKVLVDTFHANIEENDPAAAFESAGDLAAHVHVSENHRGVPGTGHVPWMETFSALKRINYDKWFVIESFSSAVKEIASAASIWRKVAPSQEAVAVEGLAFIKKCWAEAQG